MTVVRRNPSQEIQSQMARAFSEFFGGRDWAGAGFPWSGFTGNFGWEPSVDVYETPDALVVCADLPGVQRDELDVKVERGVLTISGERRARLDQNADSYHRMERRYGRFVRTFSLPALVDDEKITATYEDGILTIRLAKAESAKPRRIEIAA